MTTALAMPGVGLTVDDVLLLCLPDIAPEKRESLLWEFTGWPFWWDYQGDEWHPIHVLRRQLAEARTPPAFTRTHRIDENTRPTDRCPAWTPPAVIPGDVVQVSPAFSPLWGAHFVVVTDVRSWGVLGYALALEEKPGAAYIRLPHDSYVIIGQAEWVILHPDPPAPA